MLIEKKKYHGSACYDCGIDCFCLLSYSVFISVDVLTSIGVSVASKWLVMLLDYSSVGCSCAKITRFTKLKIYRKKKGTTAAHVLL